MLFLMWWNVKNTKEVIDGNITVTSQDGNKTAISVITVNITPEETEKPSEPSETEGSKETATPEPTTTPGQTVTPNPTVTPTSTPKPTAKPTSKPVVTKAQIEKNGLAISSGVHLAFLSQI